MLDSKAAERSIGVYLKSREGKRWTSEDTRTILARAAELDRIMERLIALAGIPIADSAEAELSTGAAFPFSFGTRPA